VASQSIKRFYFVDETGQDTAGRIFIVAVSVVERMHQELERACIEFEEISGKGRLKWHSTPSHRRLEFMRLVIEDGRFANVLCYAVFSGIPKSEFDAYTVEAIARTVEFTRDEQRSSSEIYVDGLTIKKQAEYGRALRARGIHGARIHRATDQGYVLIRLADALAGLARDAVEDVDTEAANLLKRGKRNGTIVEVGE
jgi:hypothetical protein